MRPVSVFLLFLLAFSACTTEPRSFEEEIRKEYQNQKGFFYIKVPPALLSLALKAADDPEMLQFFKNARQVGIISFGDGFPASENPVLVKKLEEMLERYEYEHLISISDNEKQIIMKIREDNGSVNELVVIVSQTESPLITLTLSGEIDIQTIVHMAADFNFDRFLQMQSMGRR
jgi:hypothetical protein